MDICKGKGKTMKRKGLCLFLAMAMVLSTGCATSGEAPQQPGEKTAAATSPPEEKIKLSIATSLYVEAPHKTALDGLIEAYKKVKPNVEISVYGSNYDNYWDNLTVEIMGNNQGDIIQMYPENIGRYHALQENGTFMDLKPFFEQSPGLKEKLAGQELCDYDGQTLAISSYATSVTAMFYRKSLFEKYGVDPDEIHTMDDLREAAKKLTRDGIYGWSFVIAAHPFAVSEWSRLIARPVSNGLYFKNGEQGPYTADNINVNSPENVWAARWWRDVYAQDKTAKAVNNKKESRELFWNGNVAMSMDGSWFVGMTQEQDASLLEDIGVFPSPAVLYEGEEYKANPTMYAVTSLISKKCEHPEAAWEFLTWMTSDEAQEIIEASGMIPSNRDYIKASDYQSRNPMSYQIYEFGETLYADQLLADPAIPQQGELQQIMIDAVQEVFAAGEDPEQVFGEAAAQMREVMEK